MTSSISIIIISVIITIIITICIIVILIRMIMWTWRPRGVVVDGGGGKHVGGCRNKYTHYNVWLSYAMLRNMGPAFNSQH